MTDTPELMMVINAPDGLSCAIKLPVRADGALPYLLSEVRVECVEMFTASVKACLEYGYEPISDSDDDAE
jgi:hypothetical protein